MWFFVHVEFDIKAHVKHSCLPTWAYLGLLGLQVSFLINMLSEGKATLDIVVVSGTAQRGDAQFPAPWVYC